MKNYTAVIVIHYCNCTVVTYCSVKHLCVFYHVISVLFSQFTCNKELQVPHFFYYKRNIFLSKTIQIIYKVTCRKVNCFYIPPLSCNHSLMKRFFQTFFFCSMACGSRLIGLSINSGRSNNAFVKKLKLL